MLHLSKLTQNTIELNEPKRRALDKFCSIPHLYPWLDGESICKESEIKWFGEKT